MSVPFARVRARIGCARHELEEVKTDEPTWIATSLVQARALADVLTASTQLNSEELARTHRNR